MADSIRERLREGIKKDEEDARKAEEQKNQIAYTIIEELFISIYKNHMKSNSDSQNITILYIRKNGYEGFRVNGKSDYDLREEFHKLAGYNGIKMIRRVAKFAKEAGLVVKERDDGYDDCFNEANYEFILTLTEIGRYEDKKNQEMYDAARTVIRDILIPECENVIAQGNVPNEIVIKFFKNLGPAYFTVNSAYISDMARDLFRITRFPSEQVMKCALEVAEEFDLNAEVVVQYIGEVEYKFTLKIDDVKEREVEEKAKKIIENILIPYAHRKMKDDLNLKKVTLEYTRLMGYEIFMIDDTREYSIRDEVADIVGSKSSYSIMKEVANMAERYKIEVEKREELVDNANYTFAFTA